MLSISVMQDQMLGEGKRAKGGEKEKSREVSIVVEARYFRNAREGWTALELGVRREKGCRRGWISAFAW